MAITKNFETTYTAPRGEVYTVVIGTISGDVPVGTGFNKELEMMEPGLQISYSGDPNASFKPIMASSLSASFKISHDQQAKWRSLMEQPEGDVFIVIYDDETQQSDRVFWFGHMLPESCTINIQECIISVDFIDGLASLAFEDWRADNGQPYSDCNLQEVMNNILRKIPGWVAYYNLHASDGTFKRGIMEVGLPRPTINDDITNISFESSNMLQAVWIQQRTFVKRKQRTEKWRQMPSDPEFTSTYDVLEDVCATFGCNFFLARGWFWMYNRQAVLQFDVDNTKVKAGRHVTSNSSSDFISAGDSTNVISDLLFDVDDTHDFLSGATETRSIPLSGVYMDHEEAGSDLIISEGVSSLGYDPDLASSVGFSFFLPQSPYTYAETSYYMESLHYSLYRWYRNSDPDFDASALPAYTHNNATRVYYGIGSNNLERRDPRAYTGYRETTRVDLALPAGEEVRLKFAGRISARTDNSTFDYWVGAVAVLKLRIEVTHEDGTRYRLKRWVKTHWWDTETGSADGIAIDGLTQPTFGQVYYYRKFHDELEWVADTDADYSDAYYEIIIPHGDNNRVESYYGSDVDALQVEYGSQTIYTPFHVEIQGEDIGDGVIFDQKVDDERGKYWFNEDISFDLPAVGGEFEILEGYWILEMYTANAGPRPNVDPTTVTGWGTTFTAANVPTGDPNYRSSTWGTVGEQVDGIVDTAPGWPTDLAANEKYIYPKEFMMTNWAVYLGDGSAENNVTTTVAGGPGLEQIGMTSSRLGSRSTYNHSYTHGALRTKYWDGSTLSPNSNFANITDYPKTKLWWLPYKNDDADGANLSDAYNSLHGLVCTEYMTFFAKSLRMVSGTLKPRVDGADSFLAPYQTMQTDKLDGISTLKLMPLSLSWSMMNGTSFTALAIPSGRYADIGAHTESNSKGPGGGRKPGALPIGKVLANTSQVRQNKNVGAQNSQDITELQRDKDELELLQMFMERK